MFFLFCFTAIICTLAAAIIISGLARLAFYDVWRWLFTPTKPDPTAQAWGEGRQATHQT